MTPNTLLDHALVIYTCYIALPPDLVFLQDSVEIGSTIMIWMLAGEARAIDHLHAS